MAFAKIAFLFNKFQQGVGVQAKSTTFAKNPNQLQFEADINKLFMFTSFNRLGKDAEEADAEEIIEIAGKSTFSLSNRSKFRRTFTTKSKTFVLQYMDEIHLTDIDKTKELNESVSESRRDNNVQMANKLTLFPRLKLLKLAEVSS